MYNVGPFFYFHRTSVTGPIVKNFFTILRTENPDLKIGVAGFCWGGKYAILLGQEHFSDIHLVDAVFAAHPSMLAIPVDVQQPFAPVSIAIAGKDHRYTPKVGEQVEEIWKKGDFSKWEQIVYKDAEHGYAVRGNMNDPTQKEDMEKAIDQVRPSQTTPMAHICYFRDVNEILTS
jgi:dienelactone hydrolase